MSERQERLLISRTLKQLLIHCLSLSLVLQMLMLTAWPTTAFADSVSTGIAGLTAESSGDATWSSSNGTITGSVSPKSSSSCTVTSYSAQTGKLTLENSTDYRANLSIYISITKASGSITLGQDKIEAADTHIVALDPGQTIVIEITSGASEGATIGIAISDISLIPITDIDTTFNPAQNGNYTVDGETISEIITKTKSSDVSYSLVATPDKGYKFLRWYDAETNATLSTTPSTSLYSLEPRTISAEFVSADTPVFDVGSTFFTDLNQAVSFAQSNSKNKITLISDGTLPAGDYTIPTGKTLLIPFDEAQTLYTTKPDVVGSHSNPSAFRTLTMADGANITLEKGAAISVGSKLSATGTGSGSWNGTPTGKHGRIHMSSGSSIMLNSGAALYAYGYISGSGSVVANSGSSVWECFQLRCWRGGRATSGMADNSQKVFPMSQYYVQNIEAPLTINAGAEEHVYTAVNMSSQEFAASAVFIGNKGMFKPSGSITKRYDGSTDRLVFDVDGDATLQPLSLSIKDLPLVGTLNLNTEDYVLPINSNITINVNSGTTNVDGQPVALLPSAQLNIAKGANATIGNGSKLYVYDKDQWGAYAAAGVQLVPVGYSTVNGTTAKRTASSLEDATVDINGTLTVNGKFYTTESGARVISSQGSGLVEQDVTPGTETSTYQATQSGSDMTYVDIPITAAQLQNADGTYYETAKAGPGTDAGKEIPYANGKWGEKPTTITITFDKNAEDATGTMVNLEGSAGTELTLTANGFEREGYTFAGWTTIADGSGDSYKDGAKATFNENVTLYAKWETNKYTIKFIDDDGTNVLQESEVEHGTTPEYMGETPSKAATAQYTYTFAGWTPKVSEVTGDATYTATYSESLREYTITWLNDDESLIDSTSVAYGQIPEHAAPSKEGNEQFTYEFTGWNPELAEVTGDAIYQASFKSVPVMYTVTWLNDDGSQLKQDSVAYGVTPVYGEDAPTKAATAQYTYTFDGWDKEAAPVTGDVTYTATYTSTINSYKVTWVDGDGTTLETDEGVEYGTMPTYDGREPTKAGTAQYTYTFAGWSPEVAEVEGDVTYQAVFEATLNTYNVTWYGEDGKTELRVDEGVAYGTIPSYEGDEPTKAADEANSYVFAGWDPTPEAIVGDTSYKAIFTPVDRLYTVVWLNDDGTELARVEEVALTEIPEYEGDEPTKEATAEFSYTFSGWDQSIAVEKQVITFTATFEPTVNQYIVRWLNDDGTEVRSEQVAYGGTPVYTGVEPSKADDEKFTYTFSGWTPEIATVTGDVDYTATYDAKPRTFTVQWFNADGTLLETDENVEYGVIPTYDASEPTLASDGSTTYAFKGWSPEISEVVGDVTYTATYIKTGWVTDENGTTYLIDDEVAYKNQIAKIGDETYLFDANGYLAKDYGLKRVINGDEINYYYFDEDGKAVRNVPLGGQNYWVSKTNGLQLPVWGYYFDENGVILHDPDTSRVGIFEDENGKLCYYIDGVKVHMGMVKVGDDYYYVRGSGELVVGASYWCTDVNSTGFEPGTYTFDGQGRMVVEVPDTRTGIFEEDGSLWYYVDGKRTYAGLIEMDGSYYYVRTSGEVVHGQRYWITKTNGLKPEASYEFDGDGRMVIEVPDTRTGIFEEDGSLWYYVDGKRTYAGLIEMDGSYYYVRTSGEVVHGRSYWISKTNGLLPEKSYEFAGDGKMVLPQEPDPSELKQGIVAEDGSLWWYVDGKRTYAGLVQVDGSYYYVRTSGEVVHGRSYWISKTNGLLPEKSYEFAEDGKMAV